VWGGFAAQDCVPLAAAAAQTAAQAAAQRAAILQATRDATAAQVLAQTAAQTAAQAATQAQTAAQAAKTAKQSAEQYARQGQAATNEIDAQTAAQSAAQAVIQATREAATTQQAVQFARQAAAQAAQAQATAQAAAQSIQPAPQTALQMARDAATHATSAQTSARAAQQSATEAAGHVVSAQAAADEATRYARAQAARAATAAVAFRTAAQALLDRQMSVEGSDDRIISQNRIMSEEEESQSEIIYNKVGFLSRYFLTIGQLPPNVSTAKQNFDILSARMTSIYNNMFLYNKEEEIDRTYQTMKPHINIIIRHILDINMVNVNELTRRLTEHKNRICHRVNVQNPYCQQLNQFMNETRSVVIPNLNQYVQEIQNNNYQKLERLDYAISVYIRKVNEFIHNTPQGLAGGKHKTIKHNKSSKTIKRKMRSKRAKTRKN
jgi:hypothetical protein